MRKSLIGVLFLFGFVIQAHAQAAFPQGGASYSGAAITTTGYNLNNQTLFIEKLAAELELLPPYTFAIGIRTTALNATTQAIFDGKQGSMTDGFFIYNCASCNTVFRFMFGKAGTFYDCSQPGGVCDRANFINDGNWHNYCYTVTGPVRGFTATLYRDGMLIDRNFSGIPSLPSSFFSLGGSAAQNKGQPNQNVNLREFGIWSRALSPNECVTINNRAQAGFTLNSGSLTTGLNAYWPLGNCTGSGLTGVCPATVGAHDWVSDPAPVLVITSPAPGAISGTVNMQATCVDNISCETLHWFLCDNAGNNCLSTGNSAVAPYTVALDTTKFVDGPYQIKVSSTNAASNTTAVSENVTIGNGITATSYFFDSVNGNDAWDCQAGQFVSGTHGPCQGLNRFHTGSYKGGDTISFANTAIWTLTVDHGAGAGLALRGPSTGVGNQNFTAGTSPLTITSYTPGGGGTCNVLPGGTTTGCTTFQIAGTLTAGLCLCNVAGVTAQNLIMLGGTPSVLAKVNGGVGFYLRNSGITNETNVIVQNNKVLDFAIGVFMASFVGGGSMSGNTIQNNYLGGSTPTTTVDSGIFSNSNGPSGALQTLVQGNYVTNAGGHDKTAPGYDNGCCGSGILFTNNGGNILNQFNVVNGFGANENGGSGNGVGNWTFEIDGATYQYNETYNGTIISGADEGGFDADGGTRNTVWQYNYAHNNVAYGFNLFNGVGFAQEPWVNNIFRFNIVENSPNNTRTGEVGAFNFQFNQAGSQSYVYNNTVYNNQTTTRDRGCVTAFGDMDVVFANNICWTVINGGLAYFNQTCHNIKMFNNDYVTTPTFQCSPFGVITGLANWQSTTGQDAGTVQVNPGFAGTPPFGTFYSGSGVPTYPRVLGYQLTAGSPLLGIGADLTLPPYNQTITQDMFGNACPGAMGGTGYNIGADGCGNP